MPADLPYIFVPLIYVVFLLLERNHVGSLGGIDGALLGEGGAKLFELRRAVVRAAGS